MTPSGWLTLSSRTVSVALAVFNCMLTHLGEPSTGKLGAPVNESGGDGIDDCHHGAPGGAGGAEGGARGRGALGRGWAGSGCDGGSG